MSSIPHTDKYAVAFIDFLGVKEMMAQDADGKSLIVFHAACKAATHMCRRLLTSDEEKVTIKMFSDNLLLCRRVYGDDPTPSLRRVTMAASMFQYFILDTMGALVRGGVTVGELYIDNMLVWGQSLVDAYRLESEKAIYPRIILDPALPEELFSSLLADEELSRDEDGLLYLDYIHTVWRFRKLDSHEEALNRFQQTNLNEMSAHCNLNEVMQKRRWQEKYLNGIFDKWLPATENESSVLDRIT